MKLTYRTRKRLALLILCVGLPFYIFAAVTFLGLFDRPHIVLEVGIYALAGVLWALPFRTIFRGVGAKNPDQPADDR